MLTDGASQTEHRLIYGSIAGPKYEFTNLRRDDMNLALSLIEYVAANFDPNICFKKVLLILKPNSKKSCKLNLFE